MCGAHFWRSVHEKAKPGYRIMSREEMEKLLLNSFISMLFPRTVGSVRTLHDLSLTKFLAIDVEDMIIWIV
jgi:hypothetical protein